MLRYILPIIAVPGLGFADTMQARAERIAQLSHVFPAFRESPGLIPSYRSLQLEGCRMSIVVTSLHPNHGEYEGHRFSFDFSTAELLPLENGKPYDLRSQHLDGKSEAALWFVPNGPVEETRRISDRHLMMIETPPSEWPRLSTLNDISQIAYYILADSQTVLDDLVQEINSYQDDFCTLPR